MVSTISASEAKTFQQRCQRDPAFFFSQVLGCQPWERQFEIIEAVRDNPRVAVRSCEGSGKSWTAAGTALWFLYSFSPSTVITTAPGWAQVEKVLWREIANLYSNARVPLGGKLLGTELKLDDKWFAMGLSTNEPARFLGYHNKNVLVILDEAPGIDEEIHEVVENPLATGFTRLLMIGNPLAASGSFYDAFNKDSPKSQLYHQLHISAFETPNFTTFGITVEDIREGTWKGKIDGRPLPYPSLLTPQAVETRYKAYTEDSALWQIYVLGQFPTEALDTLIPAKWLETARQREIKPEGGVVFGLDTARQGEDENALIARQGAKVLWCEAWHEADTTVTAERVKARCELHYPVRINIDSAPIGANVHDLLRKAGYPVYGVDFGGTANKPKQFVNIRAEMFWGLRMRFQSGEIDLLDDPVLFGQLASLKLDLRKGEQKIQIESKQNMKARGLKSPDRADALALAFAGYSGSEGDKAKVRYF